MVENMGGPDFSDIQPTAEAESYISQEIIELKNEVLYKLATQSEDLPLHAIHHQDSDALSHVLILEVKAPPKPVDYSELPLEEVFRTVEIMHHLRSGTIISRTRMGRIPESRRQAVFIASKLTGAKAAEIGRFSGRHHGTILSALNEAKETYGKGHQLIEKFKEAYELYRTSLSWAVVATDDIYTCGYRELAEPALSLLSTEDTHAIDLDSADTSWALWQKYGWVAKKYLDDAANLRRGEQNQPHFDS